MKTFLSVPGALAGLLSASALFAQSPGDIYQSQAYRPGATYYAEPTAPAKLWSQPTSNVSYKPEASLEPIQGDKAYMDALEGKPEDLGPPTMPGMEQSILSSGDCSTGNCSSGGMYGGDVYADVCMPCNRWFAYGGALIMNRDLEKEVWLSYDDADYGRQVMGTHDAGMDWSGGYEVRLGKYTGCGTWAWEGVFWAIRDTTEFQVNNTQVTGNLNTVLEDAFQGLSYDSGSGLSNIDNYFNNALNHRLRRTSDFYNVELNLFQDPTMFTCNSGCNSFSVGVLGGVRYFRFAESLSFSADTVDYSYTGQVDEMNYDIDVSNNLIGPQIGFIGNWTHGCWNVHLGSKLGIYGNIVTQDSELYGANGYAVVDNALSPNNGQEFNLNSSRSRVTFLGELDLGVDYKVFDCLTFSGGYRALAVSGVGLAADQIPQNFEDFAVITDVQASSDLILHGAYFGGEFVW